MKRHFRYISLVLSLVSVVGCFTDANQDLARWMESESAHMNPNVKPLPSLGVLPPVIYGIGDGVLDPFNRARIGESLDSGGARHIVQNPFSPLENVAIEEIKLIGIIQNNQEKQALLRIGATGKVFSVGVGHRVGADGDKVFSIGNNDIVVRHTDSGSSNSGRIIDKHISIVNQESVK